MKKKNFGSTSKNSTWIYSILGFVGLAGLVGGVAYLKRKEITDSTKIQVSSSTIAIQTKNGIQNFTLDQLIGMAKVTPDILEAIPAKEAIYVANAAGIQIPAKTLEVLNSLAATGNKSLDQKNRETSSQRLVSI